VHQIDRALQVEAIGPNAAGAWLLITRPPLLAVDGPSLAPAVFPPSGGLQLASGLRWRRSMRWAHRSPQHPIIP